MVFVGTDKAQKDAVINRILGSIVMAVIVIMLVCIAFAMKMALSMSSNIQSSIQVVEELAQGNLKVWVDEKLLARKDEIGALSKVTITLRDAMQSVICEISENAKHLSEASDVLGMAADTTNGTMTQVKDTVAMIVDNSAQQAENSKNTSAQMQIMGENITQTTQEVGVLDENAQAMQQSGRRAAETLLNLMKINDEVEHTIKEVQEYLQEVKDNAYSFETDSAKADMITGKVVAGYQWSGDAVYTMDQADKDEFTLNFAVPKESSNIYFDGWVMLKSGIGGNDEKKQAAQSFINFLSMPENAVRNMYYIGYTSVISGGNSDVVFDYLKWNYEADDDEADTVEYPLGYFFSGDSDDEKYILTIPRDQMDRQILAQYPSEDVMERSAVMQYFDNDKNAKINQMWINVRCYNIANVPLWVWIMVDVVIIILAAAYIYNRTKK